MSSVDYGNTKIASMHLYPQRRNVAAQVSDELKTVTYAMEVRRQKSLKKSKGNNWPRATFKNPEILAVLPANHAVQTCLNGEVSKPITMIKSVEERIF